MLEVKQITKSYRKQLAINKVNIQFQKGIYGLLGPNGAGKTTLLNIIMGALKPDSGEVFFEGKSLARDRKAFNAKVGYLPQAPLFYKEFTGKEFLEYVCVLKNIPKEQHQNQIEHVFREVNLLDARNKRIGAYSGGMRQRLGIAQALLGDPQVMIFDEPTAGLDPIERIRFRNTISRLSSEKTIIIATHIVPDIESIAQFVIVIKQGQKCVEDTPDSMINQVDGKVWTLAMPMDKVDSVLENHLISNIQLIDQEYILRIVAESKPHVDAKAAQPRLEEAYIYFTKGNTHETVAL